MLGYEDLLNNQQHNYDTMLGLNVQQANAPMGLAQTFMTTFRDNAKQRLLEQQQQMNMQRTGIENAYTQSQTRMMDQKYQDDLRKIQDDKDLNEAWSAAYDQKTGKADPTRLAVALTGKGKASLIPTALKRLDDEAKSSVEVVGKALDNSKKAKAEIGDFIGGLAATGNRDPYAYVNGLQRIKEANPQIYGRHVDDTIASLPQGVTMMDPNQLGDFMDRWAKGHVLANAGAQEAMKFLTPKTDIKEFGGSVFNTQTDPLTGRSTLGQPMLRTPQSGLGKEAADVGAFNSQTGTVDQKNPFVSGLMNKETYIATPQVVVQQQALQTPEGQAAIDLLADTWHDTGVPPTQMGRNQALYLAAAARLKQKYPDAKLAENGAVFKANSSALGKMQSMSDNITAFEKTAEGNYKRFETAIADLGNTASPILNKPINQLSSAVLGNPKVSAAVALGTSAITEYSRIINNPNLVGQLTDNARHELERVFPNGRVEDATLAQVQAVGRALAADAAQRRASTQGQINTIRGRIGGGTGGTAPVAGQPTRKQFNDANGVPHWFTLSGGQWVKE